MIPERHRISFTVSQEVYRRVMDMSASMGLSVGVYARRMFEAAYMARLEGRTGRASIASVLGLSVETVARIAAAYEAETTIRLLAGAGGSVHARNFALAGGEVRSEARHG